jgi:hypothetical protein
MNTIALIEELYKLTEIKDLDSEKDRVKSLISQLEHYANSSEETIKIVQNWASWLATYIDQDMLTKLVPEVYHREGSSGTHIWFVDLYGTKFHYSNKKCSRSFDQPAIIYPNGTLEHQIDGKRHRDFGRPAVVMANDVIQYWVNGEFKGQSHLIDYNKVNNDKLFNETRKQINEASEEEIRKVSNWDWDRFWDRFVVFAITTIVTIALTLSLYR